MPHASKSDLVRRYVDAYKSKDRKTVDEVLTDDFTFTSPYDDAIDKATYFERCWPNSESIQTFAIEKICEQGSGAFVLYRIVNNDGKEFRNVECWTFDGDRVREVNVYFGATYKDGTFIKQS